MSKKIMKRSLALGALMAFVITGSAMAAETPEKLFQSGLNVTGSGLNYSSLGHGGTVTSTDTITSGGISSYSDLTITAGTDITVTVNSGTAIQTAIDSNNSHTLDINFNGNMSVTANGDAHGIVANANGSTIDIDGNGTGNLKIIAAENALSTSRRESYNETKIKNNSINIHNVKDVYIESLGEDESANDADRGHAIYAHNPQSSIKIDATNDVTIKAVEGKDAVRIYGTENVVKDTLVEIKAANNVNINGQIENWQKSTVNVTGKNVTLDTDEANINSIGGSVNIIATEKINLTSDTDSIFTCAANVSLDAVDIEINAGAWGLSVTDNGNDVGISAENIVITGEDGGIRSLGNDSSVELEATNNTQITGDIIASATSTISANFNGEESFLTGAVSTGETATTNLEFNGGTWNVTGDSTVTEITGEKANIKVGMTSTNTIATVAIKEAIGSTLVEVSGSGAVSDYLAANGKEAEKEFANSVKASGKIVDDEITTEEGTVGGAYTLRVNENGSVEATQAVNTKSDAVSDAGMTLKGHWRAHMNDMNKRMGDLRMANGETGVWTRMVRGESEYQGAKMQYNQYQLGYDEKLSVDKRWTVGAAVTFSEGDASYAQGSTDDKSTAFAIYGSKLNNDGTFVDLIARYAHLESDLEDRVYGNGDYSTNGMSVSAEFGKRIEQGNGLWIEPQVELTYGTIDSADVVLSNKYKAHYDSLDSFIARAGFALGKDIKQGNVYARASYLYDFDGETTTQFEGGKPIEEDFGGGWWEVGVGANINLSKATYIYADVEKTFGGEVDTNWQWNLGVRYSF